MVLARAGSIGLSSRRSSRTSQEEDDCQDGERTNRDYQTVVDEIKSEGRILGSLQLRNEALRRLEERRGRRGPDKKVGGSLAKTLLIGSERTARSLVFATLGRRWSGDNCPSGGASAQQAVIPGRRESAAAQDVNEDAIAVIQDLELSDSDSDSDWEDVRGGSGSPSSPPPAARCRGSSMLLRRSSATSKDDSGGSRRRSSMLSRRSSATSKDDGSESRRRSSMLSRRSSATSKDDGSEKRRRSSMLSRRSSATSKNDGDGTGGGSSIRMKVPRAMGKCQSGHRSSISSTISELEQKLELSPNAPPQSVEFASNVSLVPQGKSDKSASNMASSGGQSLNGIGKGEGGRSLSGSLYEDKSNSSSSNDFEEQVGQSLGQPTRGVYRKGRRSSRLGKRRSSLFSVDERRASANYGSEKGGRRSSVGSPGGSLFSSMEPSDNSFNNSFDNSFNDSFNSALVDGDELICGWERRQSALSNSITVDHLEQEEELICGWDPSQSAMSNASYHLEELAERGEGGQETSSSGAFQESNRMTFYGWNDEKLKEAGELVLQKARERLRGGHGQGLGFSLINAAVKGLHDERVI